MAGSFGQLFTRNWPIKLAAIFFAVMLYVAVAAQQPVTQLFTLHLAVTAPPGREIKDPPADVSVLITGKGSELLKLRAVPRVITKAVPDTFSGSVWPLRLLPSDVPIPKGVDVVVADLTPRDVEITLDSAGKKEVRVVPHVTLGADSGWTILGLAVRPATARLVGPPSSLVRLDSVSTAPLTVNATPGPFSRTVALDTNGLGNARVALDEVQVSGEVTAVLLRRFTGVPVSTAASGFAGFSLATERVVVEVTGPAARIKGLSRDSLRVVAHLVGHQPPDAYARLTVAAPAGIIARARPDSVPLKAPPAKRKPGRG